MYLKIPKIHFYCHYI